MWHGGTGADTARMALHQRPYQGEADLDRLLDLLSESNLLDPAAGVLQPGDLTWWMRQNTVFDPVVGLRLFETGGRLVGFVFNDPLTWAVIQAHPTLKPNWLHELTEYAEEVARAAGSHLTVRVFSGDARLLGVLRARGYVPTGTPSLAFERPLHSDQAGPSDPGIHLRPVRAEPPDLSARVELHRAVWQPSRFTLEAYLNLRAAPSYRPELDVVAETAGGRLAAYALGWFDARTKTGEFEPVGTHPDFRGRGLAGAVLAEVMRRFQALGARRAIVSTSADNAAAVRLYQSAGFQVDGEYLELRSPQL